MSIFYNFISLAIIDKNTIGNSFKSSLEVKSIDQIGSGQFSILFPNCEYFYAKNFESNLVYSVISDDNNRLLVRDSVLDTMMNIICEILIENDKADDAQWLMEYKKKKNLFVSEFILFGCDEVILINKILKNSYQKYKEKIIIDCFSLKIKGRNKKPLVLIDEMLSIYVELMKVFHFSNINNGLVCTILE